MSKKRKKREKNQDKKQKKKEERKEKKEKHQIRSTVSYIIIIIIAIIASQHLNVVVSGSMEPAFYRGDIVTIEKTNLFGLQEFNPETDVHTGDIVVYDAKWYPNPVIHRVISENYDSTGQKYFVIKGDNNNEPDPLLVVPSQVTAKVVTIGDKPLVIPLLGYITILIRGL